MRSGSHARVCLQWVADCCRGPRLQWWGLRERAGADCHEDTLRGLEQHSKGRPGKLWVWQRNKGSFLQEGSNAVLWFDVLTDKGPCPSRCQRGTSQLQSKAPEAEKEVREGRGPLWSQSQRLQLPPNCEWMWVTRHIFLGAQAAWLCQGPHNLRPTPLGKCTTHPRLWWHPMWPSCTKHSPHTLVVSAEPLPHPAQLSNWAQISGCFCPVMVRQWTDVGDRLKIKGRPKPKVEHQGLCEQRNKGKNKPRSYSCSS